jgi:hypothetical protein
MPDMEPYDMTANDDQRILREFLAGKLADADIETVCVMAKANISNPSDDELVPDPQVAQEYGVGLRTLHRWDQDPKLKFPKPIRIKKRKYRRRKQLKSWDSQLADKARKDITSSAKQHRNTEITA